MNSDREIVITGMGAITPIGIGSGEYWEGLLSGASGVGIRAEVAETDLPIRLCSLVKNFDAKQFIKPRKAIKIMCPPIQYACAASAMAVEDANLDLESVTPERFGTVFGGEPFYSDPLEVSPAFRGCIIDHEFDYEKWDVEAIRKIQPLWMLKYLPNMAGSHVSIALNATGHSNTICQSEASGSLALMEAFSVIERGTCDLVVCGATGSLAELTSVLYRQIRQPSQRFDEPQKACRPFDRERDGEVVGEGAGALLLESAEYASKRGATPIAKISGWCRSYFDPNHANFYQAIADNYRAALESATLDVADIAAVNANALGSVAEDIPEARAIAEVFGETPVSALKANFGNLGPATSSVELIGAVMAIQHGKLPAGINYQSADPDCPVHVATEAIDLPPGSSILKSSISRTGQITSVIVTGC